MRNPISLAVLLPMVLTLALPSSGGEAEVVQNLESKYKQDPQRWSSEFSTALFHVATSDFRARKYPEAKAAYLRAYEVDTKRGSPSAAILIGLGQCCIGLKQYGEGEKYLDQALILVQQTSAGEKFMSPATVGVQLALADIYEHTDRVLKAEQTLRRVADDVSARESSMVQCIASPGAFDALAQFLERQGKTTEAEKWYARVTKIRVNAHASTVQAECFRHYAKMLRKQKRDGEAVALEKRADELSASHTRMNKSGLDY